MQTHTSHKDANTHTHSYINLHIHTFAHTHMHEHIHKKHTYIHTNIFIDTKTPPSPCRKLNKSFYPLSKNYSGQVKVNGNKSIRLYISKGQEQHFAACSLARYLLNVLSTFSID